MDPVVLFFVLGVLARLLKSDLRLPEAMYEGLSIFLLLAIGLKGGVELAQHPLGPLLPKVAGVLLLGASLPLLAFPILRYVGSLNRFDSASIAAHYGSVSMVTFAVAMAFLLERGVPYEQYMPLFVVLLEVPGIVVGILLANFGGDQEIRWRNLAHEVLTGRSIILLSGGLFIGWACGPDSLAPQAKLFFDLFKAVLSIFMLEMGLVAASRIRCYWTSYRAASWSIAGWCDTIGNVSGQCFIHCSSSSDTHCDTGGESITFPCILSWCHLPFQCVGRCSPLLSSCYAVFRVLRCSRHDTPRS